MDSRLVPGVLVRHPFQPDWGVGQVQSAIDNRVTVNFEDAGKQVINVERVPLMLVTDEPPGRGVAPDH